MARETRPEEQEGYFDYEAGDLQMSACSYCKNKLPGGAICKAFPEGIPEEILAIEDDHLEPFEGDNGIQFEGREGWPLPARLNKE